MTDDFKTVFVKTEANEEIFIKTESIEDENLKTDKYETSIKIERVNTEDDGDCDPLDVSTDEIDIEAKLPKFKLVNTPKTVLPTSEKNAQNSILKKILLASQSTKSNNSKMTVTEEADSSKNMKKTSKNKNVKKTSNVKNVSKTKVADYVDLDNPHVCEVCNKCFPFRSTLERHKIMHTRRKFYECQKCFKKFTNFKNFDIHKMTHSGEESYACEILTFGHGEELKEHRYLHTTEKVNACDICKKSFSTKQMLFQHKQFIHASGKPYECHVCQKSFTKKTVLDTHIFSHSSDKPYECQICDQKFSLKTDLFKHQKDFHGI